MITQQELEALVALLNRTPMSTPEQLWLQALVVRLASDIEQQAQVVMQEPVE